LISGITQAGISAIANETTRASINANRDVRIAEVGVDNSIIGAINNAIDELDDNELGNGTVTADTTADTTDDVDVVDVVDTTDVTVVDGTVGDDTVVDDTVADDSTGDSYYNDTECAAGQELVQTNWGTQCQ
jgi:hypothetical protein